jgi:hypothetical protein
LYISAQWCAICEAVGSRSRLSHPAAISIAQRTQSTGYKKRDQERREIVAALRAKLTIGESVLDLSTSADLVDAAVCVLAGDHFIAGRAMNPENRSLAEHEGWIWTHSKRRSLTSKASGPSAESSKADQEKDAGGLGHGTQSARCRPPL